MKIKAKLSDELRKSLKGEKGDRGEVGPIGFPGKDGVDGLDGAPGKDGKDATIEEVASLVLDVLPHPKTQLEELQGDDRLDAKHIKGIKDFSEEINILDTRTQLLNQIATQGQRSSGGLDTTAGDLRYLKLDASNDPLTGTLNFSSALANGTIISLPDATGSPQSYTMHVGGDDNGGGVGDFSTFAIEFTPGPSSGVNNLFQIQNAEQFVLISGNTSSSMGFQEVNTGSEYVWSFTSDQTMNFSSSAGNITFSSTGVGDEVAISVTCTSTGGVGTCTTVSGNHGFTTGDFVRIEGANESGYNGYVSVHRVSNTVFTYPVVASTASPATGTITATDKGTGLTQLGLVGLATPVTQDISFVSTGGLSMFRMDGNGFSTTSASGLTSAPGSIFFGTLETTAPSSLTEPLAFFNILTPTLTGRISQTTFQARIDNSGTTSITIPTGTSTDIGGLLIDAPRFVMTGSSTNSSTLDLVGAPTKTSGAGTLGNPLTLRVRAGTSSFGGNVQMNGDNVSTIYGAGQDASIYYDGTNFVFNPKLVGTGYVDILGALQLDAGTSTSNVKVGGKLTTNTTAVGNVGTGEDNLMTYSVPANTLATNGDTIRFYASGTIANTAGAKTIRAYFGSTKLGDTGTAITVNNAHHWTAWGEIIRTGATTQDCHITIIAYDAAGGTLAPAIQFSTAAETLSGAVTLKFTGEATDTDDIKQETLTVDWLPT